MRNTPGTAPALSPPLGAVVAAAVAATVTAAVAWARPVVAVSAAAGPVVFVGDTAGGDVVSHDANSILIHVNITTRLNLFAFFTVISSFFLRTMDETVQWYIEQACRTKSTAEVLSNPPWE
jgi:hypothetical protein